MTAEPSIDARRILTDARALAFPRYPGTAGDARAIEMVAERLRSTGLDVAVEPFSYDLRPAERSLRLALAGGGLLVLVSAALGGGSPGLALLVLVLSLLPAFALVGWVPWLERLYAADGRTATANVVGRRRAARPRLTLVLMAHHDSKSQSLSMPWRAGFTLLAVAGTLALLGALVAALGGAPPRGIGWPGLAAGGAAGVSLLVLSTLRSGNASPGAVDNAGSVAIVTELARLLPAALPDDVELFALSTGAEEDHMIGAMRWLDAHRSELAGRRVLCLNLDGAGAPGRTVLLDRYGLARPFSRELSHLAQRESARLGIPVRRVVTPPAMGLDTIPFAHRGIASLTFSSGSLGRATLAVHSARDRAEHLDAEALAEVARLAFATAVAASRPGVGGRGSGVRDQSAGAANQQ